LLSACLGHTAEADTTVAPFSLLYNNTKDMLSGSQLFSRSYDPITTFLLFSFGILYDVLDVIVTDGFMQEYAPVIVI